MIEEQLGKVRQGVARVIDRYAEGLIDKGEFEPRLPRLRQRLARLEEQRQQLADEAAMHAELPLIIGRLEDFAMKVHHGCTEVDWVRKRDLIRALVKRVEVTRDDVNIVFRVDPYAGESDPEKKSLQLCRGSEFSHIGKHLPSRTRLLYGKAHLRLQQRKRAEQKPGVQQHLTPSRTAKQEDRAGREPRNTVQTARSKEGHATTYAANTERRSTGP